MGKWSVKWVDKLSASIRLALVVAGLFGLCGHTVMAASVFVSMQGKAGSATRVISQHGTSLLGVRSYTIYYGAPTPQAIARLRTYPLVILEPRNWTIAQLALLKASGCKVLGYLSVLEQNRTSNLLMQAQPSDFLLIHDRVDVLADGQSLAMNINSPHYRELLITDYKQQIVQKELDGVFLDTMGDADDGIWSDAISDSERQGAAQFVASLRAEFPDRSIVQNWGIGALKDLTAPYLDGILWENFDPSVVSTNSWCLSRMAELDHLQQTKGLCVLTEFDGVGEALGKSFAHINKQHGYVGHVFADGYDSI